MENESAQHDNIKDQHDALMERMKLFFLETYEPVTDPADATLTLNTYEIHARLFQLFPSATLTPDLVSLWLFQWGFTFTDKGSLKLEWLLKRK